MQELEKIFKEIDTYSLEFVMFGGKSDAYISSKWVKDIIRKHMNAGWIPVERRLPINHEGAVEVTVGAGYRTVGYYDQYREEWWTLDEDSILDVIAWKEPSEPYRPERSMN